MHSDIKQLWITKLRSGEYRKGVGQLRNDLNEYCALGVLCEMYRTVTGKGQWVFISSLREYSFEPDGTLGSPSILPETVRRWAGLEIADEGRISRLNDGTEPELLGEVTGGARIEPQQFPEIADFVENWL